MNETVAAPDGVPLGLALIDIAIGRLLLWLDHRVRIPRYRPARCALTIGKDRVAKDVTS